MASYDQIYNRAHSPQPYGNYGSQQDYGSQQGYGSQQNLPKAGQSPYGSGDPYYNESTGFVTPQKPRKGVSPWVKFGIPVAVLVIIGVVVGVVLGIRKHNDDSSAAASNPSAAASAQKAIGVYATATNSLYMMPIYPSTTNAAAFSAPTTDSSSSNAWPADSFKPSSPSATSVRDDHPVLIAPAYKWAALPNLIKNSPYLQEWDKTIMGNASDFFGQPVVTYFMDGPSGMLDNSRDVKRRVKAFGYAYRMTNDTKWVDRTWTELQNAIGKGSQTFGPSQDDPWNSAHFLDVGEMTAAFGIAYDWMYDKWSDDQKSTIRNAIVSYGLNKGVTALVGPDPNATGWWSKNTTGNWNCVCNGGLTMGALAILKDDTTGTAQQILGKTVDNAKQNCAQAPSTDGTWSETPNYWYFGMTGFAEMVSSLQTATGDDYGMIDANKNLHLTGLFHMYTSGPGSIFSYGDHGPNKYSSTANNMFFLADQYKQPLYALFQRDQWDAADPFTMMWYDPTSVGAFWDGLALDYYFDNQMDQWTSMRSSWTDENALYVAMKAGMNVGHQTHNDLDCGDFVLDAMGARWAGELGSGDYRSPNYFSNDTQESDRWKYYRKMTEGQNTILVDQANQLVTALPSTQFKSSETKQGSSTVFTAPSDSTAYFIADLHSAYNKVDSFKRGVRLINGRTQVLIQDEITASANVQWRMHTNATVSVDSSGTSATLTIGDKTMKVEMVNPPSGAKFGSSPAKRFDSDPTPPAPDQENPGVTVLTIDGMSGGTYNLQVLFTPQSVGSAKTPPSVNLDSWSLTSHN